MQIPIVDYKDRSASERFVKSIKETGFAVITNTPVCKNLIRDTYSDFEEFFKNETAKAAMLFDPTDQDGFFPNGSEKAKGATVGDIKEFFHFYPNRKARKSWGYASIELCFKLEELAITLLKWLEEDYNQQFMTYMEHLELKWGKYVDGSPGTLFRVLHYPPVLDKEVKAGAVRASAHEDINFITLLPAATQPGLQVLDAQGNWHDVGTDENSIIVNVGDMLQELTGGFYKSTTHRVVNPTNENVARYSMPLFLHPHPDTVLSERHTAHSYLMERLKELGLI